MCSHCMLQTNSIWPEHLAATRLPSSSVPGLQCVMMSSTTQKVSELPASLQKIVGAFQMVSAAAILLACT